MSQIVYKMKKVLNGCTRRSAQRYNDCDMTSPFLLEDELKMDLESSPIEPADVAQSNENSIQLHVYNESISVYDNLNHPPMVVKVNTNALKDLTNGKKSSSGFKRAFKVNINF